MMMKFDNKFLIFNIICIILIFFSLLIKLFTYYTNCLDEPTDLIILRYQPAWNWNNWLKSDCPYHHHAQDIKILFRGEEGLIFEDIYFFIVHYAWWLGVVLWMIFLLYHLRFSAFKNN